MLMCGKQVPVHSPNDQVYQIPLVSPPVGVPVTMAKLFHCPST